MLTLENFADTIEDKDHKELFSDSQKLTDLKNVFVRFAAEENHRRTNKHASYSADDILKMLYPSYQTEIIDPIWKRKNKQLQDKFSADQKEKSDGNKWKAYD